MNLFPLLPASSTNEMSRPGQLFLEYFQVSDTVATLAWEKEVPTSLGAVLGVIGLGYTDVFGAGDYVGAMTTDGVITTGAVTVRSLMVDIGDVAVVGRGFLVGTKSDTALTFA